MRYVIWSFKHRQWWGPGRRGYTPHLEQAGRYTDTEAGQIVTDSIMGESVTLCERTAQAFGAPTVAGLWAEEESVSGSGAPGRECLKCGHTWHSDQNERCPMCASYDTEPPALEIRDPLGRPAKCEECGEPATVEREEEKNRVAYRHGAEFEEDVPVATYYCSEHNPEAR